MGKGLDGEGVNPFFFTMDYGLPFKWEVVMGPPPPPPPNRQLCFVLGDATGQCQALKKKNLGSNPGGWGWGLAIKKSFIKTLSELLYELPSKWAVGN